MTKFSEIAIAQKKHDIHLAPTAEVEHVICREMVASDITDEHIETTKRMLRFLSDIDGLGLAAPQIGLKERFFVYWNIHIQPQVIYNPKWYPHQKKQERWPEKCLSYGEQAYLMDRYKYINAVWWEYDSVKKALYKRTKKLRDIDAIVFQHETDHLNGRTISMAGAPVDIPELTN